MGIQSAIERPGVGLDLASGEGWIFNRTAATTLTIGDFVHTDDGDSTTGTTATGENTPGGTGSFLASAVLPTTATLGAVASGIRRFGGFVIALDPATAGAVGGLVKIRARGRVGMKAAGAITIGSFVAGVDVATTVDDTTVAGQCFIAKALVAASAAFSSTGVLTPGYANCIEGFGASYAS